MSTKKLFKNFGFMSITKIIIALQGILMIPLLTRFLGAEDYGVWSQIKITTILLSSVGILGLELGLIKFISGKSDKKDINLIFSTAFTTSLVSTLILSIFIIIFAENFAVILTKNVENTIYFQLIALLIFSRIIRLLGDAYFIAQQKIKEHTLINTARTIFEFILIFVLLKLNFGILAAIISLFFAECVGIIVQLYYNKLYSNWEIPSKKIGKELLNFSIPLTFVPILFWIIQSADQYMIGYYLNTTMVGIYAVMYTLSRVIRTITDPILITMLPALNSAWERKNIAEAQNIFSKSYQTVFMIAIPSIAGISILAKPIVRVFSTTEFLSQTYILPILSFGMFIFIYFSFGMNIYQIKNQTKRMSLILLGLAIINLILNFVLIPIYSNLGAAIATAITFTIGGVYGIMVIKNNGFSLMPKKIFIYLISSTVMATIVYSIQSIPFSMSISRLITSTTIGIISYGILLILFKEIGKKEFFFLKSMFIK